MKTIAEVLIDGKFRILGSNNHKKYITLSCGNGPFRLYIPYPSVPVDALFERSKRDSLRPGEQNSR